jgi:hypothetical protein
MSDLTGFDVSSGVAPAWHDATNAGVVKLVDALDSKSSGAYTPCRFDSGLRH